MYESKKTSEKLTKMQYNNKMRVGEIIPDEWQEIEFHTNLKAWRTKEKYTMKDIVNAIDIDTGLQFSWQYIQKIESGKVKPSYDFISAFRMTFKANSDEIFFDEKI